MTCKERKKHIIRSCQGDWNRLKSIESFESLSMGLPEGCGGGCSRWHLLAHLSRYTWRYMWRRSPEIFSRSLAPEETNCAQVSWRCTNEMSRKKNTVQSARKEQVAEEMLSAKQGMRRFWRSKQNLTYRLISGSLTLERKNSVHLVHLAHLAHLAHWLICRAQAFKSQLSVSNKG